MVLRSATYLLVRCAGPPLERRWARAIPAPCASGRRWADRLRACPKIVPASDCAKPCSQPAASARRRELRFHASACASRLRSRRRLFGLQNTVFDSRLLAGGSSRRRSQIRRPGATSSARADDRGYMVMFDLEDPRRKGTRRRSKSATISEIDLPDISGTHLHQADIGAGSSRSTGRGPIGAGVGAVLVDRSDREGHPEGWPASPWPSLSRRRWPRAGRMCSACRSAGTGRRGRCRDRIGNMPSCVRAGGGEGRGLVEIVVADVRA